MAYKLLGKNQEGGGQFCPVSRSHKWKNKYEKNKKLNKVKLPPPASKLLHSLASVFGPTAVHFQKARKVGGKLTYG